jgi:hypothetical protein
MRGFWDTISDAATGLISDLGITGDSATAVARAMASPTMSNIKAVQSAFADSGTSAPPELMEMLWGRYYDSIASNPLAASGSMQAMLPWLIGGGVVLILLLKRKG